MVTSENATVSSFRGFLAAVTEDELRPGGGRPISGSALQQGALLQGTSKNALRGIFRDGNEKV